MINFFEIPVNLRAPGVYVEVTNILAQSGLAQLNTRILVIGQRLSSGSVAAGVPTLINSKQEAANYFGRGSMLAVAFSALFDNNPYTEKWAVALDDAGGSAAAVGTITITGPATANGTINLYIAGVRVQCGVTEGDVQNTIATNLAAAINANLDLVVTAAHATNVVTLTAQNKGVVGNTIDLRFNYYGAPDEVFPAGTTCAISTMTGGTGNPNVSTAITALPDEIYNFWLIPYSDQTNLDYIETELVSRWSPLRQLDGHAICAVNGSVSTLTTFGGNYNFQHLSVMDAGFNTPNLPYVWAAATIGQVAFSATNDPALPFNTLQLIGILPPPPADRRTITERNVLLYAGIATHKVLRDGTVTIDRLITTYQTNSADQPDSSYLDANTLFNLSYLKQTYVARMTQLFSRCKLAADGAIINPGQLIVTPSTVKGEIIALFKLWELIGLVQNIALFKAQLLVQINISDPTRLDVLMPPTLISGLQVIATQLAFQLQFGN